MTEPLKEGKAGGEKVTAARGVMTNKDLRSSFGKKGVGKDWRDWHVISTFVVENSGAGLEGISPINFSPTPVGQTEGE